MRHLLSLSSYYNTNQSKLKWLVNNSSKEDRQMRPIIEFCTNNMHHGTEKLMKLLEQNPEYDVIEYGCLGNCGECYLTPYALVNGEVVAAPTVEELQENILHKIKESEALFDLLADD
jgi:uncharacterized protein YuzB (UPF0349 family)